MNTNSASGSPARVEYYAAGLYAAWAALAGLADALAAAPLAPGFGLILGLGAALTAALFLGLRRLPAGEQPSGPILVVTQSVMCMAWATLYGWMAAPTLAGSLIGVGMYVSAIAITFPAVTVPVLGRLMLLALGASAVEPVLQLTGSIGAGAPAGAAALLSALVPWLALAVILAALYVPTRHLANARTRLQDKNAELSTGIELIRRHAERDHLTNSYSREFILEMVAREKSRADRSGEALCLCLLDIDHFKDMNDRYGHLTGDRILSAFARRVRGALRTMDTVNNAGLPVDIGGEDEDPTTGRRAFGRVGGEEFIVLLPETSLRGALKCAERVRKAVVRRPFDGLHQVTVSIGIAEYQVGETVSSLIDRADEALYGAKNAGRNRVHCATTGGGPNAIVMPDLFALKGTGP